MKKSLLTTTAVMVLSASMSFNSLAKAPIPQVEEAMGPSCNEVYPGVIQSPAEPSPSSSSNCRDCPPDYENEETARIEKQEGDKGDSSAQSNNVPPTCDPNCVIIGDMVITFDSLGNGTTDSTKDAAFYWRDKSGNVWSFDIRPDLLLDGCGEFSPKLYQRYCQYRDDEGKFLSWQQFYGARKIVNAE